MSNNNGNKIKVRCSGDPCDMHTWLTKAEILEMDIDLEKGLFCGQPDRHQFLLNQILESRRNW